LNVCTELLAVIITDRLTVDVAIEKQALLTEFWHWNMLRWRVLRLRNKCFLQNFGT